MNYLVVSAGLEQYALVVKSSIIWLCGTKTKKVFENHSHSRIHLCIYSISRTQMTHISHILEGLIHKMVPVKPPPQEDGGQPGSRYTL